MKKPRYCRDDSLPRVSDRDWISYAKNCDNDRRGPRTDEVPENAKIVDVWVSCGECNEADEPNCPDCHGRGGRAGEMRKDWLDYFSMERKAVGR